MSSLNCLDIHKKYILVLKSVGERIEMVPLEFEFDLGRYWDELERMCQNNDFKLCDLEEYVLESPLAEMIQSFDHCDDVRGTYQGIRVHNVKGIEKCQDECENEGLIKRNLPDKEMHDKTCQYHSSQKKEFVTGLEKRKYAYMLGKLYDVLQRDEAVLAFSHQRVGFSQIRYSINDDFSVIYKTNFGYGYSSYFFTIIEYKSIQIIPYSEWITYWRANKHEIIRYTRKHAVAVRSWEESFAFTVDAYNLAREKPVSFVKKWIVRECVVMVEGLEDLLNRNEKKVIYDRGWGQKILLNGDSLLDFKGEKISGALSFLSKIESLSSIWNDVNIFIKRILDCNLSIYPSLQERLCEFKEMLADKNDEIKGIEPKWTAEKALYNTCKQLETSVEEELKRKLDVSNSSDLSMKLCTVISFLCPEFDAVVSSFEEIDSKYSALIDERNTLKEQVDKFEGYVDEIELHFSQSGKPIEELIFM